MRVVKPSRTFRSEWNRQQEINRQLLSRSAFTGTGVHPNGEDGLDSDNYVPATSGFSLNGGTGVAEFKDILLYDLPNSMLASPMVPAVAHDDAQGFAVTTSSATILTATVPVPDGYTQALVLNLTVAVTAYNQTAGVDFLYCNGRINGTKFGWALGSADVDVTGTGVASDVSTTLLTGLSGGVITFTGTVYSAFGTWAAHASHVGNLDAAVHFLR